MGYLRFFALLAVVGMACDSRAQGTKEVWLDELDLSCCIQDWGLPQADRSVPVSYTHLTLPTIA